MKNKNVGAKIRDKQGNTWLYTDIVKDHFFNPRNILPAGEENNYDDYAFGRVGSPACGDEMVIWIKVDKETEKILDCKWQTFGCGSAIASTSILSEMVTGMKLDSAMKLRPQDIIKKLGGLPNRKIHCSVLGDKALRLAINDWFRKTGQHDRIIVEGARIIDEKFKITNQDIEEAVIEGVQNLNELKEKLKLENLSENSIPEIEQLIHFYFEKYYTE